MNKKVKNILEKKNKTKIVSLTAYSKNIAQILDKHCDIILVGDSVANVLYGFKNTHQINLDNLVKCLPPSKVVVVSLSMIFSIVLTSTYFEGMAK